VAGANCAIGAYLLQATRTALGTSAARVVQNRPVTYTATITPAADGGTVSFDDGAGTPATTRCAARPVSNGTATCTVSYASLGTHPVTATYSGDGAGNNYAGSASAARSVVVVAPAATPPTPTPNPPVLRCSGRQLTILDIRLVSGRATVRGLALVSHRGERVTLRTGTKRLGTARVRADGSFTATVRLPSTKGRQRVTAEVAGKKSLAFAPERRFVVLSRVRRHDRVRVTARVVGGERGATVRLRRQVTCRKTERYGRTKLGRNGRFTISLPLASAADGVTFYRARAPIRNGSTFTFPIAVTTKG
jgi:hypothetical protein